LCQEADIPIQQRDFTVDVVHQADEAFVTGTFGGLTPVREIDGHKLRRVLPGPITQKLRALYEALKDKQAAR
jgi:branched-chain amino acid aminotransferase